MAIDRLDADQREMEGVSNATSPRMPLGCACGAIGRRMDVRETLGGLWKVRWNYAGVMAMRTLRRCGQLSTQESFVRVPPAFPTFLCRLLPIKGIVLDHESVVFLAKLTTTIANAVVHFALARAVTSRCSMFSMERLWWANCTDVQGRYKPTAQAKRVHPKLQRILRTQEWPANWG